MKRICMMMLAILMTVIASAQYNDSAQLHKKGGRLYLGDEKLDKLTTSRLLSDYSYENGAGYDDLWRKANGMRTAGIVLTSTGAAAGVTGSFIFIIGFAKVIGSGLGSAISGNPDDVVGEGEVLAGAIVTSLGTAMLCSGIPLLCIGNKRMKNIVSDYNSQSSPAATELSLAFGPCPSGIGFSLKF